MKLDISKSLDVIKDVTLLGCDIVQLVKAHGIASLPKVFDAIAQVKKLVVDFQGALPELQDLDSSESSRLASASYVCFQTIFASVKA